MSTLPTSALLALIIALIALSSFFSATESAFINLNRHRLRHQAKVGHRGARLTARLLQRPERLIGAILFAKTLLSVLAALLAGKVALRYGGSGAMAIAIALVTFALLVIAEIAPRTYGLLNPERVAMPASWLHAGLVRALHPVVWVAQTLANGLLRLLGTAPQRAPSDALSAEELRTAVAHASNVIPPRHRRMLTSILDLETTTVEDIMIPRSEIASIDIEDEWEDILELLRTTPHTRLPVCAGDLDNIIGILHMKKVVHALTHGELSRDRLHELAKEREGYFVPEGTTLNKQLLNFQRDRRRIALVVDEYGDILGLVTLEDILEEIVGEFTSDPGTLHKDVLREADGCYVAHGTANIRVLNRTLGWNLPTEGPRTLNGLILEHLETIPDPGTWLRIGDLSIEILQIADNAVKTARLRPLAPAQHDDAELASPPNE